MSAIFFAETEIQILIVVIIGRRLWRCILWFTGIARRFVGIWLCHPSILPAHRRGTTQRTTFDFCLVEWPSREFNAVQMAGAETMPHVPLLNSINASKESQEVYEEFHKRMDFPSPPNFIMTQGHSATTVRGTWELVRNVLVTGAIPRWTKEMMFVAISRDRNCCYCAAAHLACCRMLGVNRQTLEGLVCDVSSITDPKLRDMILFAIKCSRDPQALVTGDFDNLRQHGLKNSEIVEVIAMSALAVYANIIADATAMEADEMFDKI